MRLIINNGAEVLDIPYDVTALEICKGNNGRAFMRCNTRSIASIFDFDTIDEAKKEVIEMAKAAAGRQAYYYLRKGSKRNDLV